MPETPRQGQGSSGSLAGLGWCCGGGRRARLFGRQAACVPPGSGMHGSTSTDSGCEAGKQHASCTCGALPRGRYQRRLVWLHIPASRRYSNSRRDRGSPARGKGQPDARENCTVRARCSATATSAWDSSRNVVCAGRLPARARQPDIAAGAGRPAKELVAVGRLRTDEGWFSFDYIFPDGYTYRCPFKSRCGAGGQGRQAWWLSGCTPVPWCAQSSPTPPVTATTPCPAALTSTRTASTSASWSARRGVLAATHLQGAPAGWQQMLGSPRGGGKRNAAACPYLLDLRPSLWRASCCARLGCSFP